MSYPFIDVERTCAFVIRHTSLNIMDEEEV
ncbi:hypothetical protein UABAM_06250 [Candidatus Uabimicrobium amorphum]|uniref:Uncharacterized protein n=1 Tax=Uabimicrobium amorphum TaxID=2596890 RepID=A0A5S9IWJ1_UABAM|nr:hypothetical protein UABAM_06250 [Candidatus Uabimicrobium amorphum]